MVRRLGILLLFFAASPAQAAEYRTGGGDTVRITGFPEVAPQYAEFFASLPHGPELASLRVTIVDPAVVPRRCGQGMTACYVPRESMIIAPGPRIDGPLLAHEYGHHVAANRQAPGFSSLLMGPPHWASQAHVCARLRETVIGVGWRNEPAEAWADVYAGLVYPELSWRLSPVLRPPESAFAAALADVLTPWRGWREITFSGRFGEGGSGVRRVTVPLRLDGQVDVELEAERALRFDLRGAVGRRRSHVARERRLRFSACRSGNEATSISVLRRSGSGPFSLTVRYPG